MLDHALDAGSGFGDTPQSHCHPVLTLIPPGLNRAGSIDRIESTDGELLLSRIGQRSATFLTSMAPPRRRGGSPHTGPSLFLLLLSQGAAAGAGFIIPPQTGPASVTRLYSISPSSSSSAAAASHPVAAQAAAPPPVRTKAPQASPTTTTRRSAPLPPPPPPSLIWEPAAAPAVVEWHVVAPSAPPVAAPAPVEAKGGWRAAEKRLRALVAGAQGDNAAVIGACKGLLQACVADGDEAAEGAVVAWAVKDVLLPLQKERRFGGEDEALRALAFRWVAGHTLDLHV